MELNEACRGHSRPGILLPQYQDNVDTYSQPAFFGEIAFMLWLVHQGR